MNRKTKKRIPIKSLFILLLLFVFISGAGCDKGNEQKEPESTFEIEKEYKRGPITFTLKVSQKEITIADRLRLIIEAKANEEYEVQLPEFGEKLDQFGIVDYDNPSPRLLENDMTLIRKSYELDPFLSGEYKIPPMKALFWKKGQENEKKHEIESEELTIMVKSLLPATTAELVIKEIVPPMEPQRQIKVWLYVVIGAFVLAVVGLASLFIWYINRSKVLLVVKQPAHEIAYQDLEKLLAEDLVEKGEIKAFYLKLSHILRYYTENRFALRVSDQTTEEFLIDLQSTDVLISPHKHLLQGFLQHCDVVKFAEYQPSIERIQKTFDACKLFISETEIRDNGEKTFI